LNAQRIWSHEIIRLPPDSFSDRSDFAPGLVKDYTTSIYTFNVEYVIGKSRASTSILHQWTFASLLFIKD
jgi:hypothetical protein